MPSRKAVTFSGKPPAGLARADASDPMLQRLRAWPRTGAAISSPRQARGQRGGRQPGGMQNLVGVGIADSAEQVRIGKRALQRVVLRGQPRRERFEAGLEHLEPARVQRLKTVFPFHHVEGRPLPRPGFGQHQTAAGEVERRQIPPWRQPDGTRAASRCARARLAPVKPSGDHQVQHQPAVILESDSDALSEAPQALDGLPFQLLNGRRHGAEQERAREAHPLEPPPDDARLQGLKVDNDVRELRHGRYLVTPGAGA